MNMDFMIFVKTKFVIMIYKKLCFAIFPTGSEYVYQSGNESPDKIKIESRNLIFVCIDLNRDIKPFPGDSIIFVLYFCSSIICIFKLHFIMHWLRILWIEGTFQFYLFIVSWRLGSNCSILRATYCQTYICFVFRSWYLINWYWTHAVELYKFSDCPAWCLICRRSGILD